ncbi:hypothetical protein EIN_079040 [Entamoeba invadens IP1]|uniref:hypothetical protein n=1 Tax=Entamoeba invadens IP1 TaxID=370355 RepID=UPI0002C3F581|nr:hypothetical protein EIN_079040 [Entamoeba invadens IP1]ELP85002.1 hypothetical protein EIN_079040 [Entamoeba invadens IP1]|eukprot:XP_004184348.1 hypothetical protein EIN_079040 [Entamoeba invadens IP1]
MADMSDFFDKPHSETNDQPIKYKDKQQMMMTLQSKMQSVLIMFLLKYCDMTVGRPHRKCFKTVQFLKIKQLRFGNDILDIQKFVRVRCQEMTVQENSRGISQKTALRRTQLLKRQEVIHLMSDLLLSFNVFVEIEKEEGEGIDGRLNVFKNGILLITRSKVEYIGAVINQYICSLLENGIAQVDITFSQLFNYLKDKIGKDVDIFL